MKRLLTLIRIYAVLIATFAIEKPLFMLCNKSLADKTLSAADYTSVVAHGLLLDASMAGYLIIVPLVAIAISIWLPKTPVRNILTPYYAIAATALSAVFVVDTSLYEFWKFKLDSSIFNYLDSPGNAAASISWGFIAARVISFIALASALIYILWRITPRNFEGENEKRVAQSIAIGIITIPLFISIRGGVGESTANIGKVYFSPSEFLNHSAVNPAFSFVYSLGKNERFEEQYDFYTDAQLRKIMDGLYPDTSEQGEALLNTQRPNVLIIVMEGFGQMFLASGGADPQIAPNMNRLAKEGICFTNCYSNSYRTDRGLVSTLSGYPAFPGLSVMKIAAKSQRLPSIARKLKEQGYTTSLLYGGDINFTNMQGYFRSTGYDEITSDTDFALEQRKNAWGVNDDITTDYLYQQLMNRKDSRKPWHTTYLTLSSHEPFEVPYSRLDDKVENSFAFTDHCLGRLIERLRHSPLWKNLLIVCIPDHGVAHPENISHERLQHNQMLWLGGAIKRPRTIATLMSQTDLAATLLSQMGIDHGEFALSRNVMSPAYKDHFVFCCSRGTIVYATPQGYIDYDIDAEHLTDSLHSTPSMLLRLKAILQSNFDSLGAL